MNRTVPILLATGLAVMAGLGVFTFTYGEGFSYFSSDPKACVNCHIMNDQFDSWSKSSHHAAAVCVDCHMPHTNIFAKLYAKTDNGLWHSKGFTLQDFHEPIQIRPQNSAILQANCIRCHSELVHGNADGGSVSQQLSCIKCHSHAGHGSQK